MRRSHETYELVFGTAYTGLMTNVALALTTLPLVVVALTTDPATTWPVLVVLAPLVAPSLAAAFAVFAAFSRDGTTAVVRTYARAWRAHLRRALLVGAVTTVAATILVVDVAAVWGHRVGAVAIPVLAVALLLLLATSMLVVVGLVEAPDQPLSTLARAAPYLAVRRWPLSVLSVAALGTLFSVVGARPALGLGLAAAPLLYLVWANGSHTWRPLLAPTAPTAPTAA